MNLSKTKIAVLVEDLYQDLEAWYPVLRLREAGATVVVAGTGSKTAYRSKRGLEITADADVHELNAADFDGVVIPGGFAPDTLRCYDAVLDFVRDLFEQGKVVASICHGPWVLCSAGVLQGRMCTSYVSIKHDIIHAGAEWRDEEVVVDGNLITSRVPNDLPAFLKAIIVRLAVAERKHKE
jgi:protease I